MKQKITIASITIRHQYDESPDTSFLGEYTDDLRPGVIVRSLGDFYEKLPAKMERDVDGRFYRKGEPNDLPSRGREFRGFVPYAGGEKAGTRDFYRYGMQDFKRMEALNNGDFSFIGISAKAVVKYDIGNGSSRLETLSSGGLWGIESDSGSYLQEVAKEQIEDLKEHLDTFGVNLSNFDELAANAETKNG